MAEIYCAIIASGVDPDPGRYGGRVYTDLHLWQIDQKDNDWSTDVCVAELCSDITHSSFFSFSSWDIGGNLQGPVIGARPGFECLGNASNGFLLKRAGSTARHDQPYGTIRDIRISSTVNASSLQVYGQRGNVVERCIFGEVTTATGNTATLTLVGGLAPGSSVRNCVTYSAAGQDEIINLSSASTARILSLNNNLTIGSGSTVMTEGANQGAENLYNNIAINCAPGYIETPTTSNAGGNAGDASLPGDTGISTNISDILSTTDFHLSAGGIAKYAGNGIDIEASAGFSDDFDLEARPPGDWTIGPDQAAGGPAASANNALWFGQDF